MHASHAAAAPNMQHAACTVRSSTLHYSTSVRSHPQLGLYFEEYVICCMQISRLLVKASLDFMPKAILMHTF